MNPAYIALSAPELGQDKFLRISSVFPLESSGTKNLDADFLDWKMTYQPFLGWNFNHVKAWPFPC